MPEFGGTVDLSKTWAMSLMNRMGLVCRKGTKEARKQPAYFGYIKQKFLQRIADVVGEKAIPDDL